MRYFMALAFVTGVGLAGCGDDSGNNNGNHDLHTGDLSGDLNGADLSGDGGSTGGLDFEDYVVGLITNHTNNNDLPDDYTKAGITTDSMDPSKFTPLF
jgi:hypothetical protein